jgi:hypothetical protein
MVVCRRLSALCVDDFSATCWKLLENSNGEAVRRNHPILGTELFLWIMLRDWAFAAQWLQCPNGLMVFINISNTLVSPYIISSNFLNSVLILEYSLTHRTVLKLTFLLTWSALFVSLSIILLKSCCHALFDRKITGNSLLTDVVTIEALLGGIMVDGSVTARVPSLIKPSLHSYVW